MGEKLPVLKSAEVVKAFERGGFVVRRQTGSHIIIHKLGTHHTISIPLHPRDLPKGTPRAIIRQAGIKVEEFLEILKE
jgi:predicted RNA binding protein YcfA (HicA-like mRNA interferase family)